MTTKLTFGLLLSLGVATTAFAQEGRVGINTETPKTTFDVNGKKDGSGNLLTTDVTGMQAPRLTRAELTAKGDVLYGADQKGALVYITDVTAGDALTQRINITAAGYYYFDGMVWQNMTTGLADPTTDAWIDNATNTRVELGTLSNGATARPAGTEFVIQDDGKVGIGIATPTYLLDAYGPTAQFRVGSNNAYFRIQDYDATKNSNNQEANVRFVDGNQVMIGYVGFATTGTSMAINNYNTNADSNLQLGTSGISRIHISSNGNVGIGTTTPTSKLQVVGLPIYVDNVAALAGGLTVGAFYHAGDGIVRVVF